MENIINSIINNIQKLAGMYFTCYAKAEELQAVYAEALQRMEDPDLPEDVDDYFIHWDAVREYNHVADEMCEYRHAIKHLYIALKAISDEEWRVAKVVKEVEQSKYDHYSVRL